MQLTIGMAVYNDFHGVYYTVQALRMYQDLSDCEILVVDNYGCETTKNFCEGWSGCARYVRYAGVQGTAAPRQMVFEEAKGDAVLCIDSHVLLATGSIELLKRWFSWNHKSKDMLQGPMLYDDLQTAAVAMDPEWRDEMFGVWRHRQTKDDDEPFEIPMHGLGLFAMRKDAWPGFNPDFRGFGGEEGYIHEKVRQRGGKCLCLPWLRWHHCFHRPGGIPYRPTVDDKFRNYLIGCKELGMDPTDTVVHFASKLSRQTLETILREIYP